jgi:hypothetical protein
MNKVHPDKKIAVCCAPENASLDCCQSAEGKISSCCDPGSGKHWNKGKSFVSAIIILAAIGVGANSIIKANSAQAGSSNTFSSFLNEKSDKADDSKSRQQTEGSQFSFNRVMDSLQAIDAQAADKEVVFIALPAKGQDLPQSASRQMETMLGKLPPSCQKVGAFTLSPSATDYDRLVQRLEIKTFPCFVALGRQGSPAIIPADGDLSEAQMFKAYLAASKGENCCSGAKKALCCPSGKNEHG